MSYPEKGALNLQQVVRELEKRIEALEPVKDEKHDAGQGQAQEGASEPAKVD